MNFALSAPEFSVTLPSSLPTGTPGDNSPTRLHQVSLAMEQMFAGQLMSEMSKGIDGSDDEEEGGQYSDFIQQAMSQGLTSGGGLGLAKMIEQTMNRQHEPFVSKAEAAAATAAHASKLRLEITTVHHGNQIK